MVTKSSKGRKKSLPPTQGGNSFILGLPMATPVVGDADYMAISQEGYCFNPYVRQSVDKISETCASTAKWLLYQKAANGDLAEIQSHPVLDLLNHPSQNASGNEFVKQLFNYYELAGNAYVMNISPDGRKPAALVLIPPTNVKVHRGAPGVGNTYEVKTDGGIIKLGSDDVLHLKTFNPLDDLVGQPPAAACWYAIKITNDAAYWNLTLIGNDMRAPGILTPDGDQMPNVNQMEALQRAMQGWTGKQGAGRIPVLSGKWKFQPMNAQSKDGDWSKTHAIYARQICATFGVPPVIIDDVDAATYANYQTAMKAFYTQTVLPLMDKLCDALNQWLVKKYGQNLVLKYDTDGIDVLRSDNTQQIQSMVAAISAGLLTPNEARAALDYGEIVGGDELRNASAMPVEPIPIAPSEGQQQKSMEYKATAYNNIQRRREYWVLKLQKMIQKQFKAERDDVMLAYMAGDVDGALEAVRDQIPAWQKVIMAGYVLVGEDMARRTLQSINRKKSVDTEFIKASVFDETLRNFLYQHCATRVVNITDTTMEQIRQLVGDGVTAGEGTDKIARRIDSLYMEQIIPHRSEVISRTEALSGANISSNAAAKSTGLKLRKTWKTTLDNRERPSHEAVNGMTIDLDEMFVVDGERMEFPMDASHGASAANVIQCRCAAIYTRF